MMVLYIYGTYLLQYEWASFSVHEKAFTHRLVDYVWRWELDIVFEHLKAFTFSEAMLHNLDLYLAVGAPVAVLYFWLERNRIRWLQGFVQQGNLPVEKARLLTWGLELYLWMVFADYIFILLLVPFHLGLPRAHYVCAGCAFTLGIVSLSAYLWVSAELVAMAKVSGDVVRNTWALRAQNRVRPALKLFVLLHFITCGAAYWKVENLGSDGKALLFGVLETLVILSYQGAHVVFALDDVTVGSGEGLHADKLAKLAAAEIQIPKRPGTGVPSKLREKPVATDTK
eukprot:CAMPEP_0172762616 /NCGR_PEP_ID=MMETSP1074-20121228/173834_1 /TAXON_ID=2916 /ORGANISM="Ceratium fusus, Strain PA161109" /LENGTH=283 /DNA_ID=CAMNT_0013597041 /DNA_START=55 /DNA_END=906 /DNA_ORIENTATION=-